MNVSLTTRRMSRSTDKSAGMASTWCCDASLANSISVFLNAGSFLAQIVTLAPSFASAIAIALPIPLLEPPTIATLSFNPRSIWDLSSSK